VTAALPLDELRRSASLQAASLPGLRLVILFGSITRSRSIAGGPRIDSDVDLALLGGDYWLQLGLGSELAARLGREPHVVDLRTAPEALAFEVARTGILLFEHERFAWASFQATAASRYFDFQPARQRCIEGTRRRLLEQARAAQGIRG
jgi:predicted nucleotidyltransferase